MKKSISTFLFSFLFISFIFGQNNAETLPPKEGPGSPNYAHEKVVQYDFAKNPDGYWLFEPSSPRPDSANLIVFNHGYGGYNPMIYGQWIRHLVRKGNIVIFPRYQKNMYFPRPPKFSQNVSQAIRDALKELTDEKYVQPISTDFAMVGHSYGGVVSADLAVNFKRHKIPEPTAIFLVSPGTGFLSGGVLDSYDGMSDNLKLVIMVSQYDDVVGDKFGKKVFREAKNVKQRNFIRQLADMSVDPPHYAGHNESYAIDLEFDNGKRNYTSKKALRMGKTNNIDFYGYWKIFDALLDCSRSGKNCDFAFGNTNNQKSLGKDLQGKSLRELEVTLPE